MNLGAMDSSGLLIVYNNKHSGGLCLHSLRVGGSCGKAEIAMLVHGRHFDDESIIIVVGQNVARLIPVIARHKGSPTAVDSLAGTAAGEPGNTVELTVQGRICIKLKGVYIQHGVDTDTLDFVLICSLCNGRNDADGLGSTDVSHNIPATLHLLCYLLGAHEFLTVKLSKICHISILSIFYLRRLR